MSEIYPLVEEFRRALENAKSSGEFTHDAVFEDFPNGCCGDTCDLLGQYLIAHGIRTDYVAGIWYGPEYKHQTHVWLVSEGGLIIDITGDQFKDKPQFFNFDYPVYVGQTTAFHELFQERNSRPWLPFYKLGCFEPNRLPDIYSRIMKYI